MRKWWERNNRKLYRWLFYVAVVHFFMNLIFRIILGLFVVFFTYSTYVLLGIILFLMIIERYFIMTPK